LGRGSDHTIERDRLVPPTIVLVHGAFAESASWDRVIDPLLTAGHPVIAAANPLSAMFPGSTLGAALQAVSRGERPPWKELPSWFLFGEEHRNIPAELQHFMAKRAGAHRTTQIPGGSHAVTVAHPDATAHLILEAAPLHAIA
jgi:pimeloyl-ACP methyl ester carboxylesterase